jgi:methylase of polypeptide subunit release factors
MEGNKPTKRSAKVLWKKVRNILLARKVFESHEQSESKNKQLFQVVKNRESISYFIRKDFTISIINPETSVVFDKDYLLSLKNEKSEVDQTGLRVWIAEEYLTRYILDLLHSDKFLNLKQLTSPKVLEIGAGVSGLASLAIVKYFLGDPSFYKEFQVDITDGNEKCIPALEQNILMNQFVNFKECNPSTVHLIEEQES